MKKVMLRFSMCLHTAPPLLAPSLCILIYICFTIHSCLQTLQGYNGQDLFGMQRKEMERMLDRDEAHRLDSQLTVQKNISGVNI